MLFLVDTLTASLNRSKLLACPDSDLEHISAGPEMHIAQIILLRTHHRI